MTQLVFLRQLGESHVDIKIFLMQFIEHSPIVKQLKSMSELQCGWPAGLCFLHVRKFQGTFSALENRQLMGKECIYNTLNCKRS